MTQMMAVSSETSATRLSTSSPTWIVSSTVPLVWSVANGSLSRMSKIMVQLSGADRPATTGNVVVIVPAVVATVVAGPIVAVFATIPVPVAAMIAARVATVPAAAVPAIVVAAPMVVTRIDDVAAPAVVAVDRSRRDVGPPEAGVRRRVIAAVMTAPGAVGGSTPVLPEARPVVDVLIEAVTAVDERPVGDVAVDPDREVVGGVLVPVVAVVAVAAEEDLEMTPVVALDPLRDPDVIGDRVA